MHYRNATLSDLYEMMDDLHNDPNIQEVIVEFFSLKSRHARTEDPKWIRKYLEFASDNIHILPIDEVLFSGTWWRSPEMIMTVFGLDLMRLGILPRRPRRKN